MAFMIKKKRYKFQVNLCLEELSEVTYRYDFAICILYFFIKKHPIFVHGNRRINHLGLVKVEIRQSVLKFRI